TALMGATLPLLARQAVRRDAELGARVGLLYTINTAGAVAGTLATAFALLPALGLAGCVHAAIAVNGAVFLGGVLLARGAEPAARSTEAPAAPPRDRRALILPIMLLPGAASLTFEVLWTRL